jgi:hypothetical protein
MAVRAHPGSGRSLLPMTVVLLGDMEFPRPAHLELAPIREITYFVIGNHDTDTAESWANLSESELADRCIDGRVVTLPDGTRVAVWAGFFGRRSGRRQCACS